MTSTTTPRTSVRLSLEGMTCAACANRIERKLNRLDGVAAAVNFATEQASVDYDPSRAAVEDLIRAVEAAGYRAGVGARAAADVAPPDRLRTRLVLAAALSAPLVVLAMAPPLQFDGWEWLALALATPVVWWAGWPFHRAAALNARHGAVTMDTLISIGTLAAWTWSVVGLLALDDAHTYFEVGAVITTLILLGRFLETGARRRSGAAIRALLELGAKEARVLRDGQEVVVPVEDDRDGRPVHRATGRAIRDGRRDRGGALRRRPVDAHGGARPRRGRSRRRRGGRNGQHVRAAARPCDTGRQRDRCRTDRPARRGGAGRQGAHPAARRPDLRRLRPDRAGALPRDARRLARAHRRPDRRVHRLRRRADHRLPLRARSCDTDGPDGRDRPRSAARDRDQGPRGARANAPNHDDRPRQDGDGHRGADVARDGDSRRGRLARRAPSARRGRRGRERAPDRPSDRRRRARGARCAASRRALHQPRRTGRRSGRRGARDGRRPARAADRAGNRHPVRARRRRDRRRRTRDERSLPPPGTAPFGDCWSSATASSRRAQTPSPSSSGST